VQTTTAAIGTMDVKRFDGRRPPAPAPALEGRTVARGKRVYLRTLAPADLPRLGAWAADPFLEEMVGSDLLHTFREVYRGSPAFLDWLRADASQLVLVIVARKTEQAVGLVRLFNVHRREGYAFLETMVADRAALRSGYGIEGSKLVAYYAVDVMGLRRLEAKVYPYNLLSVNTMKRRRWQQEGVLRQATMHRGEPCDLLVFGILREEILANKQDDDWTPAYFPLPGW
jgi:ribosomal-protein-alanine N-acetyltransferase